MLSSRACIFAASFLCIPLVFAYDIDSVRVGDTVQEAEAAMLHANPRLSSTILKSPDGETYGVVANTPAPTVNDGSTAEQYALLHGANQRVWMVAKTQRYSEIDKVKPETIVAILKQKYGRPSGEDSSMVIGLSWEFDRSGKQYIGPLYTGPCTDIGMADFLVPKTSFFYPKNWIDPTCGIKINAFLFVDRNGALFKSDIQLIDGKGMFDSLNPELQAMSISRKQTTKRDRDARRR